MSDLHVSHVGLCTHDLPATLRFWVDGLGFEVAEAWDLDTDMLPGLGAALEVDGDRVAVRSQMIRRDGVSIEVLAYDEPAPTGRPSTSRGRLGLTHLAFWVDDLEATVARLVEHGGTVIESTRQNLGVDLLFVEDPTGVRVELMRRPG
jgi:glyoxylase I family protein